MLVRMELARILITEYGDQQMIFLREADGDRHFPIMIGVNEALAIDRRLKGQSPPRPMTHDLMASVIEAMGGRITKIVIGELREHVFIATLFVAQAGRVLEIDARPSDAIALGVAFETPIFVAEQVLDALAKTPDTKADRLQLLRDRLAMLEEHVGQLGDRLEDPAFCSAAAPEELGQLETQLEAMRNECEQIRRVLAKLG